MGVSPPHSSGNSPFSLISCFTLSMLAPSLSICRSKLHFDLLALMYTLARIRQSSSQAFLGEPQLQGLRCL